MAVTSIRIPDEQLPQVDEVVEKFGFKTKEEFVQEAIRDKILELQKKHFVVGTDRIAKRLKEKGIQEKEIVEGFNRFKHS